MRLIRWTGWRRDLFVGLLASAVTAAVLVPLGGAALRDQRQRAEQARDLALQAARPAELQAAEAGDQAGRNLVDQAARAMRDFGVMDERPDAEVFRVSTDAVAPEIPQGAHVLIDKKARSFAPGDIVVFRVEDKTYLGRVLRTDAAAGLVVVGRNGEPDRQVPAGQVIGRGVLNTR